MTLRERLEAVVRRYLRSDIEFRSGAREDFLSALVQAVEHEALLDTMAMPLKSQPSRKTLENILGLVGFDVRVRNTSRGSWPDLIDTVMAWAQGQPEKTHSAGMCVNTVNVCPTHLVKLECPKERPQPSREALTELLNEFARYIRNGMENPLRPIEIFEGRFLAWSQGQSPEPMPSPPDPRPVAGRCPADHPIYWLPCRCCASCACGYGWGQLPHAPRPAAGGRDA